MSTHARRAVKLFRILKFAVSSQFFFPWLSSLIRSIILDHHTLKDNVPWLTFKSRVWLEKYLKSDMSIFEYGSGGSSIFISKKTKEIFSIEHNKEWYQIISKEIENQHIGNCKLLLIEPERDLFNREDYSNPNNYLSSSPIYRKMNFRRYVLSIDDFPDDYFDMVIVDGRARNSCIANSMPKIKSGGYLLLDDSERETYNQGKKLLSKWASKSYYGLKPYGSISETTVWRKSFANERVV